MNVLVAGQGHYSFRHALLGEAVYDDLLPGERVRLHAAYAEALRSGAARGTAAELARHARLAMDLPTALTASVRAGDEAERGGRPGRGRAALRAGARAAGRPPARRGVGRRPVQAGRQGRRRADGQRAPDPGRRPGRRAARAARRPTRRRRTGPGCSPPGPTRSWSWRPTRTRSRSRARPSTLAPEGASGLRAKVLAVHARILSSHGRFEEAQAYGLEALGLAERLDLPELASEAITTLSGLKKAGPKEACRSALEDAVAQAQRTGALHAELRGRWLLGRSYEDWAEFDETERWFRSAIDRAVDAGVPWAPFAFESRLAAGLGQAGARRVGRAAGAVRRHRPVAAVDLARAPRQHPALRRGRPRRWTWPPRPRRCAASGARRAAVAIHSGRRRDAPGRPPARRGRGGPDLRRRRRAAGRDLAPVVQRTDPAGRGRDRRGGAGDAAPARRRADGVRRPRRPAARRRARGAGPLHATRPASGAPRAGPG